ADDPPQFLQRLLNTSGADVAFLSETQSRSITTDAIVITGYQDDVQGAALSAPIHARPEDDAIVWFSARNLLCPDAVTVSQAGLVNGCESLACAIGLVETDVVATLCAATSELGPIDTLMPLLGGACCLIPESSEARDPARAARLIASGHATVVYAEGAGWARLLGLLVPGQRIRKALCRRDTIDAETAARLLDGAEEFWALHGYPQTGGCTSARLVKRPFDLRFLGAPLDNVRLCVLDGHMNVPPVGAAGDLYALGWGTAPDGADAGQSADFASIATGGGSGRLLFRTGETARRVADGAIEIIEEDPRLFVVDGHTFSSTTLVSALLAYPEVAEAAVSAAPATGGLRAYIKWRQGLDPRAGEEAVRARIAAVWPRAAQPHAIVTVDSLPRAADGSIDLRRLDPTLPAQNLHDTVALDPQMEQRLAAIWSELLKVDRIDPNANFFELGGHSLLAARMLGRVETEFRRRVTLSALFRSPTIRGLSRLLRSDCRDFDFRQVVKLHAGGHRPTLIAINNTGVYYLLAKRLGADQPVTSLQVFDPANKRSDCPDTLEAIAAEYVKLIRRVQPQTPYVLMGWCVAGTLAFEIARQLEAAGHQVAHLFLVDSWVPGYFDRLSVIRGLIGNYTLKWQLLADDWRSWRRGRLSRAEFFASRPTLKRLLPDAWSGTVSGTAKQDETPESYDRWLLEHLKSCNARYEPKPYRGHISLIRSTREPTGWLFDPNAGWGAFAAGGVDLTMVEGNHFTMFQEPGVTQMAAAMRERIGRSTESDPVGHLLPAT
ncbi:MAG TPA: thioesterase domain-containing protein, partial [Steroidobacteraceae bacterium]|nr:thioesterase domain-containing protein [Steroidobacteraceae bacterium]